MQCVQFSNHLGSASLELDDLAQIISYEEYYPYGSTSYQAVDRALKAAAKRYRYTGMERDEESGLNYHRARYYAVWLGSWLSPDAAVLIDGSNLFRYARDNPIGLADPVGTDPAHPRMVSEDDLRKNGANLGVGIQVPRAENTIPVTVNNVDQLHTERTTLDRVLKSPEYIDNNIVKVFVKGDVWTLSVDYLQFEYANGSKLTVPANRIDLGPGPNAYANEFTKVGGIIIPGNDGNPRFDRLNTPRIVEGAELVSEHIQRAKTDRVFYGKLVLGFQIALASLVSCPRSL